MNTLILNRESFELPVDGWYQLAPVGEFAHEAAGVLQVVDPAACEAMVNAFQADSQKPNFAGLLIDFDHFSLDGKLKSEAAGWIVGLEYRGPRDEGGNLKAEMERVLTTQPSHKATAGTAKNTKNTKNNAGLWGKIRWSDTGEDCVRGGRYRFISPVWARSDCEDLGNGRVRPVRLLNAAVTNDPNLKGMVPLSNRAEGGKLKAEVGKKTTDYRPQTTDLDLTSKTQRHKGDDLTANCSNLANAAPAPLFRWELGDGERHCPSCAALAGQVHSMADWEAAGLRPGAGKLFCTGHCHCKLVETDEQERGSFEEVRVKEVVVNRRRAEGGKLKPEIANTWSDVARAASMAVRKAKALARADAYVGIGDDKRGKILPGKILPVMPHKPKNGIGLPQVPGTGDGEITIDEQAHYEMQAMDDYAADAKAAFKERYGYSPTAPDEIQEAEEMAGVPEEYRTGGGADSTQDSATGDGDQEFQRQESEADAAGRAEDLAAQDEVQSIHDQAEDLMARESDGEDLSAKEKAFLKRYREVIGDLSGVRESASANRARGAGVDEAAVMAVRRDKGMARGRK